MKTIAPDDGSLVFIVKFEQLCLLRHGRRHVSILDKKNPDYKCQSFILSQKLTFQLFYKNWRSANHFKISGIPWDMLDICVWELIG